LLQFLVSGFRVSGYRLQPAGVLLSTLETGNLKLEISMIPRRAGGSRMSDMKKLPPVLCSHNQEPEEAG
jgi:hypothetical protein